MDESMRKIKRNICAGLVGLSLLLGLTGCVQKQKEELPKLFIGCDNYTPFSFLDQEGEADGVDVKLATEACARMGYEPVFLRIDWGEKDTWLKEGKIDCIWSCFPMNDREDAYLWVGPYMYSRQVVAVKSDSEIEKLGDLEGKRVAVQEDTTAERVLLERNDNRIPQVGRVYSLAWTEEAFAALQKSYVDACAGHEATLQENIEKAGEDYRILEEDLIRTDLGVAFSKTDERGIDQNLKKVLDEMLSDGTTEKILKEYGIDTDRALGGIGE